MSEDGSGSDAKPSRALDSFDRLADRVLDQRLVFMLAFGLLVVIAAGVLTATTPSTPVVAIVIGALLALAISAIALFAWGCRTSPASGDRSESRLRSAPEPTTAPSPAGFSVTIGEHGEFVGGDQAVATDCVLTLLELPAERRRLDVNHVLLTNRDWARANPGTYLTLKANVDNFQHGVTALLQGGVSYHWKWEAEWLVAAVRNMWGSVGRQDSYESWYAWPTGDLDRLVTVRVPLLYFTETDYYRELLTPRRPVAIDAIDPQLVWEHFAPAVVLRYVAEDRSHELPVNLNDYLVARGNPAGLTDLAPEEAGRVYGPQQWSW
ncbi:hypothetical protein M6D93_15150 [Jatrophihabitans telluris]|uniref:DUF3239 domain-containing protein n=1 Tax=Jatrophihabitans telluris TaxID=2038343 RepID=A0ABY4QWC0_9ACTN|nr:hypothetical protein [Jatrophihabitans telluris]UQX87628.1 hypothetical protein M6D93_15150 [Jatrophihabitans telluris]